MTAFHSVDIGSSPFSLSNQQKETLNVYGTFNVNTFMQDIQPTVDTLFDFSSIRIDEKKNLHTPVRERIYELLTPAYFRLGTVDEELENILRTRIDRSVSANQPITLIIAYGGFKNIHIDAAPHIDWAEVF